MRNRQPNQFLDRTATRLKALETQVAKLDGKLVGQDIAARRVEAKAGREFATYVDQIDAALKASGRKLNVDQWCKQTIGVEITTMRRRKRLYRHWRQYEVKRRKMGQCGQSGLLFALSLVQDVSAKAERTGKAVPVRSQVGTKAKVIPTTPATPNCEFITGDALNELPKFAAQSVNVIVASPPYWPAKRAFPNGGIGFEPTLGGYIDNLVAIFREARRVLKEDGTLWVNIDDTYASNGGTWTTQGHLAKRPTRQKSTAPKGMEYPDTTYLRPAGNLLFLPARLAMALQDDGWICRAEIIWYKGPGGGRPESVANRVTKNHEKVFMFTKLRRYFYDPDPIREPLVGTYSPPGKQKSGLMPKEHNRDFRVYLNPMGGNAGSVWTIPPSSYRGSHPATMPEELVRRCLLVSCPEHGTVLDVFGGAGTTALVALDLGHRAISIEISDAYTKEARHRVAGLDVGQVELAAD